MTEPLSRHAQAVLEVLRVCERGTAVRRLAYLAGLADVATRKAVNELDTLGLVMLSPGGSGGKIVRLAQDTSARKEAA